MSNIPFVYKSISELGTVVTGKTPSTSVSEYFDGEYPFITPTDIATYNEKYLLSTERTISKAGSKVLKSNLLPPETICFVCIGSTIGKMCKTNAYSFSNQQINSLIPSEKYDSDYLFYNLRFLRSYFQLIGGGTGSGKGIVNKTAFSRTKMKVVEDIRIQHKIATILNNYDNLIENNKKRIQTLEELSNSLFKEWFIRFRFPGHEKYEKKESELGRIPSCFDVVKMNDIFNYYVGGGWGEEEPSEEFPADAYVIRGTDFPLISRGDVSSCPYRFHKLSNYTPRKLQENDIVLEISGGTAEQPVGRAVIITEGVLEQLDDKVICASFCKLIRPDYSKIDRYFLYHWLKYLYDARIVERYQLQSTGIINFKFEYFLKKGPVLLPKKEIMSLFDRIIEPIREEIDNLAKQNANLIKQRDSLLPRLMSGKLSVEGKEIV
jgi:type I restriction enzyme S subunit